MFILECGEQYGFVPADDELIYSDYPKLNFNGQEDINFNACSRVVFLDAPMGAGKTYVDDEYIKSLPSTASVLSVTFRISLAQYLASRLNLNSYLDPNIWDETEESKVKRDRLVVCLDSIYKVKKDDYDVVLLGEGNVRGYHFWKGASPKSELAYLRKFEGLLEVIMDDTDLILSDGKSVCVSTRDSFRSIIEEDDLTEFGRRIDLIIKCNRVGVIVELCSIEYKKQDASRSMIINQQSKNARNQLVYLKQYQFPHEEF